MKRIYAYTELDSLEDGTVIVWERIPGDNTSLAIAFVHQVIEDTGETSSAADLRTVTWVSPGGWQPMEPQDAGINYPCMALGTVHELIAWAPVDPSQIPVYAVPDPWPTVSGGTWGRDTALAAASRVCGGRAADGQPVSGGHVLNMAETFLRWLQREPDAPDEGYAQPEEREAKTTAVYRPAPDECCCGFGAPLVCGECGRGDHSKCKVMSQMGDSTP